MIAVASATTTHTPQPSSPTTGVKPALVGLLGETGVPTADFASVIGGYSIGVGWDKLQPVQGGPITTNNFIDKSIAVVRAYNAAHPGANLRLKVRVKAGVRSPDWAKTLDGAPVSMRSPGTGATGTVPRFWTANYAAAYQDLQNKLAAQYDAVPEVAEIVASRCTTFTAEPFLRDRADPANVQNLLAAGFTQAADRQCIQDQFGEMAVWQHTRVGVAFSSYEAINADGTSSLDLDFPNQMIAACRTTLGARCMPENDNLNATTSTNPVLQAMALSGGPIGFQTAKCSEVGSIPATLTVAVHLGADSVELCSGYEAIVSPAQISAFPAALAQARYSAEPPEANTIAGSPSAPVAVSLRASVNPEGTTTMVHFEYGTTTAYGSKTSPTSAGSLTTTQPLTGGISGLRPGTTYHFRVVATNAGGTTYGVDRLVTTTYAPLVSTLGALPTGHNGLVMTGSVNPKGQETSYWFQYGTTSSFAGSTAPVDVGNGNLGVSVSANVASLPASLFYYRLVAQNASGISYGLAHKQLVTTTYAPLVSTLGAMGTGTGGLVTTGSVNPKSQATTYWFQYGSTTAYGSQTPAVSAGAGIAWVPVRATLSGLTVRGLYHYRLVAQNGTGVTYGLDHQQQAS